ncbi:MAG: hypothetical protein ABR887_07450 [Methanoregulaceae archaeon]|jgi:hypothetical protein
MTDAENLRVTLQIHNDRNNNANTIIHATNGFTLAFFVGILTIFIDVYSKNPPINPLIYSLIGFTSIFELCAWRLYANYVDEGITSGYKKIVYCQENLHFPKDISLKESLSNIKYKSFDRGHTPLDVLALFFACEIFYFLIVNPSNSIFQVSSLGVIIFFYGGIIWYKRKKFSMINFLINQ